MRSETVALALNRVGDNILAIPTLRCMGDIAVDDVCAAAIDLLEITQARPAANLRATPAAMRHQPR